MGNPMDFQTILFAVACLSTFLFVLKWVLFMVGGTDGEVEGDFSSIEDSDASFNFFSIQSVLAFFMGFGWSGVAALHQFGLSSGKSAAIAVVVGLFFMAVSAYLMRLTKKLNQNVRVDYNDLAGQVAKTYTAFSPKGNGQIQVTLNKQLTIVDATNASDEKLPAFADVVVQKVEQNVIYITKK